jgi:undecaprenyl-diphosphatase
LEIWQAILLAIIEGLTEFLPVSSTGHMIIASTLMGIEGDNFVKMFTVAIQFGAILAVVVLYSKRFLDFRNFNFYLKLGVAFIPAAVVGLLAKKHIDMLLESVTIVGVMLLLGGIFLLFVDSIFKKTAVSEDKPLRYRTAFEIGCFQVLAMVPGVSRSAATIIGGMTRGLNRKQAAEFSFFLAVPTMFAATAKSMLDLYLDHPELYTASNMGLLALGNILAFIVAMIAIKGFINWLQNKGFKIFGWYRIAMGLIILISQFAGVTWTMLD